MKSICCALIFFIVFPSYLLPNVFYKPGTVVIHKTVGNNIRVVGSIAPDWNFFTLTSFFPSIKATNNFSQGITKFPSFNSAMLAELHQAWLVGHGKFSQNSNSIVLALKNKKILASNKGSCTCCFGCPFDQYDEAFEARINQQIRLIQGEELPEREPVSGRYSAIIAAVGDIGLLDTIILFKNYLHVWQENKCDISDLSQEHQNLMSYYVEKNLLDYWSLLSRFSPHIQQFFLPSGYISVMFILIDNNTL